MQRKRTTHMEWEISLLTPVKHKELQFLKKGRKYLFGTR